MKKTEIGKLKNPKTGVTSNLFIDEHDKNIEPHFHMDFVVAQLEVSIETGNIIKAINNLPKDTKSAMEILHKYPVADLVFTINGRLAKSTDPVKPGDKVEVRIVFPSQDIKAFAKNIAYSQKKLLINTWNQLNTKAPRNLKRVISKTQRGDGSVRYDYVTETGACYGSVVCHANGRVDVYMPSGIDFLVGHGHMIKNSKGEFEYLRPSTDPNSFGRKFQYTMDILSNLDFGELQMVEALSTNEYVKHSARFLIQSGNYNKDLFGPVQRQHKRL